MMKLTRMRMKTARGNEMDVVDVADKISDLRNFLHFIDQNKKKIFSSSSLLLAYCEKQNKN